MNIPTRVHICRDTPVIKWFLRTFTTRLCLQVLEELGRTEAQEFLHTPGRAATEVYIVAFYTALANTKPLLPGEIQGEAPNESVIPAFSTTDEHITLS